MEHMKKTMSIEWAKRTFESLEKFGRNRDNRSGLTDNEYALVGRYGAITYMLKRDGIWPPTASPENNRFRATLCEVLFRLPQNAFDKVEGEVRFLLDDPSLKMFAVNAPPPPSQDLSGKPGIDTIVFFRTCMDLPPKALIGLIAQQIAHSFVCGKDYSGDEVLAETKAREWGFGIELDCLKCESKRLYRNESGSTSHSDQPVRQRA
jgi:hypothetical protein